MLSIVPSVEECCDIYLTKDNCILMDVVSHFNKFTKKQFHLDIGKFVSLPNLSWVAWLLRIDPSQKIETVSSIDQYNICESAERGGLSQCRIPWVRANIEGRAGYRVGLPNSRIHYTDVNSLYASAMRYFMHTGNFFLNDYLNKMMFEKGKEETAKFCRNYEKELNDNLTLGEKYDIKFNNAPCWKQSNRGFIALVAGHYPDDTHHKLNDLPPLFLNRKITKTDKINKRGYGNEPISNRLIASLLPVGTHDGKKLEAFHYMELKIALERGFVVDYFGETLWFNQAPILKDFCDEVQELRKASNTEFEKSFYKLILNSLYGIMLMNTRKFCDSYLVSDKYEYQKMKESNRIKFVGKLSDDLLFVSMEKKRTYTFKSNRYWSRNSWNLKMASSVSLVSIERLTG